MTERAALNLRLAIDEITLAVAQAGEETELAIEIVNKAVEYLFRARGSFGWLDEREIERPVQAIVKCVLQRLEQIAASGGQIGSAQSQGLKIERTVRPPEEASFLCLQSAMLTIHYAE
jgi:hypothetical protein